MAYKVRKRIRVALWLAFLLTATAQLALGQYGQTPGDLLDTFRALRPNWFTAAAGAANRLFGLLALIEFVWTAVILVLDKSDLQGWTAALIRRMMFVGAFLALLVNGPLWIPAIIDSFAILGQNAAGIGRAGLSPGDVFVRGLQIAANLGESASRAGFFVNPGSALALVTAAILTFLAFVVISVHFIMALVESYVVIGAGFIFLGFGGSRWTAPYVERYIALAVAVGVKLMVLYMLIGAGMSLSGAWTSRALTANLAVSPIMEALDIMGGALIFGILCWQAPKFTASLLGGSPAFSGGDVAALGLAGAQAGIAVATLGAGAVKLMAARGAASAGAMTVNQAVSLGAGSSGGSNMAGSSSLSSAVSGGQAGGTAGTSGGSGEGKGRAGKGSDNDGASDGGVGFGGGGRQPKPPTIGGASAGSNSGSGSSSGSSSPRADSPGRRASGGTSGITSERITSAVNAGGSENRSGSAGPVESVAGGSPDRAASNATRSPDPGIATPIEGRQNIAPPRGFAPAPQTLAPREPTESHATNPTAFSHGTPDLVAGIGSATAGVRAPMLLGKAGDAAFKTANDPTLDSPQTLASPQTVSSLMRSTSPMTMSAGAADGQSPNSAIDTNLGRPPSDQPAPPPLPAENGMLEKPQTISSAQTITSPMTNSNPMTTTTATTQNQPAKGAVRESLAHAASIAEQVLDRSGRFTQGLRQSLPPDGAVGGGPAQLNLNSGE